MCLQRECLHLVANSSMCVGWGGYGSVGVVWGVEV